MPQLHAKSTQIAEVCANLGWLGMHPSQVHANLGSPGEGEGQEEIAKIAEIAKIGK